MVLPIRFFTSFTDFTSRSPSVSQEMPGQFSGAYMTKNLFSFLHAHS